MANGTRDFAKNKMNAKKRPVAQVNSRPWYGAALLTICLIGVFIFALLHLHKVTKPTLHPAAAAKKEIATAEHPTINKPRFEFYSILPQSDEPTPASTAATATATASTAPASTSTPTPTPTPASAPAPTASAAPATTTIANPVHAATKPVPVTNKPMQGTQRFFLQVAALKNKVEVERLKKQLATLGYSAQVQTFDNHGNLWLRVSLGPYVTLSAAEADKQKLKQNHYDSILRHVDG